LSGAEPELPGITLRMAPGTLLLAAPSLLDPNFMHTVVLLVQHDDDGAFGFVINRVTDATLGDLLPDHPELGESPLKVHGGGPVGLDTLQVLHRAPRELEGGAPLGAGLFLGVGIDELAGYLAEAREPLRQVRLFVGYSGWGAGQLDDELANGSWIPRALDPKIVFSDGPSEAIWRHALRTMGESGAGLASQPPDPKWN